MQHLQCDRSFEPDVTSEKDRTHLTTTQLAFQRVVTEQQFLQRNGLGGEGDRGTSWGYSGWLGNVTLQVVSNPPRTL